MIKRHIDTLGGGLVAGLVLPALTLLVIWIVKSDLGLGEFLKQFQQMGMLSKLLSLSAIPNPVYLDRAEFRGPRGHIRHPAGGMCHGNTQTCLSLYEVFFNSRRGVRGSSCFESDEGP